MTKRKRRRARGPRGAEPTRAARPASKDASAARPRPTSATAPAATRRRSSGASRTPLTDGAPTPAATPAATVTVVSQPDVSASIARGVAVVARSPAILASVFLVVLLLWLTYSSSGVVRVASPGVMAQLVAVPPVHSLLDIQFLFVGGRVFAGGWLVALAAVLLLVRAASSSFWISCALDVLDTPLGERPSLSRAARRAARAIPPMLGVEGGFAIAVYLASAALGTLLGALGLLLGLVGVLFLFVYVPIAVVARTGSVADAVRAGMRAARVPGRFHLLLVFTYVFASILLLYVALSPSATPATPSILVWSYALFISFLHVGILSGFVYRWTAVRERALAGPVERRTARRWSLAPR